MPAIKINPALPVAQRKATKMPPKKRVGDLAFARWYEDGGKPVYCACGRRLRTDTVVIWCSGPECLYFDDTTIPF